MDISFHDRFKQCLVDSWTTREHLCLASAVTRNGDQNWAAVSRTIRFLTAEVDRPQDWYSTKNCALQYDKLLEQVDIPKRKREKGESNLVDTPGETVTKMLARRYMEELAGVMEEEKASYEKLRREIQLLESDQCSNRLHHFWDELVNEQDKEDEEEKKIRLFYKDREERIKILQSATKLQSPKGPSLTSPLKSTHGKDYAEKLDVTRHSGTSGNSSEGDSEEDIETDSQSMVPNVAISSSNLAENQFVSSSNNGSVERQTYSKVEHRNIQSKNKDTLLEENEKSIIVAINASSSIKSETCVTASENLLPENHCATSATEKDVKDIPLGEDSSTCDLLKSNLSDPGKIEEYTDNVVELTKRDVLKVESGTQDKCEILSEKESKGVDPEKPEISKSNPKEFSIITHDIKEAEKISLLKTEENTSLDMPLNHTDTEHDKKSTIREVKAENIKINKDVQEKIEIQHDFDKAKIDLKNEGISKTQNVHCEETKKCDSLEDFDRNIESVDMFNKAIHVKEDDVIDLDSNQLVRRGRKRKIIVTPLKEESKTKTSDVKAKIKLEEGSSEIEGKLNFDDRGKKELWESSSSDELQIEKLHLGDEKKKDFQDEKKKSIKKEVKDEYEFDDDISRDSTDVKEFYMSRVDRRKFSLADGICSPVVSESAPSSPASTSYGDDIEAEKHHRSWKRSIMLIWSDIAAHKNASLFLRPITEEKVPGYHSIVFRPIDLLTIKRNVENGFTKTTSDFQRDIMLMFLNAKMYNTHNHNIYRMADEMMRDVLIFIEEFVNTQMIANAKILETPQKNLRRETRESSAKRGDDRKKDEREEKTIKRRKLS